MVSVRGGGGIVRGEGGNWSWGGEGKGGSPFLLFFVCDPPSLGPIFAADMCFWQSSPLFPSSLPLCCIQKGGGGDSLFISLGLDVVFPNPKHFSQKIRRNFFD